MTKFQIITLWIGGGGVLVTLLAVIVAIWGEKIRSLWASPKLLLRLAEPAFNRTAPGRGGWYYMVQVTNSRKSYPAKNVRVLLTRVEKKAPDGSWQPRVFSGPTQVMWRWPAFSPLYATVGPSENATFGALLEDEQEMNLQMYLYPNNLDRIVKPNDPTRLTFQAVSDTSASREITIQISWDGKWEKGLYEMQQHCIVKAV